MRWAVRLLASGGFVGHVPGAPGTAGSALALALWWVIPGLSGLPLAALVLILVVIGVPVSTAAEDHYGRDGRPIVIDEIAGFFVSVLALPKTWEIALASFFLFRLLDVLKPFPAGRSQMLRGGWGVVADDVIVGVYTNALVRGGHWGLAALAAR